MLAHPQLPPGLIERCLDVLKEIMPTERELIRVVVEVVIELRDEDDNIEMNGGGELTVMHTFPCAPRNSDTLFPFATVPRSETMRVNPTSRRVLFGKRDLYVGHSNGTK